MKLTFPIDTLEPGEIPAFSHIFDKFPEYPENISRMIKYLCWRFDPKSKDIRAMTDIAEKVSASEKRSGYKKPSATAEVSEDGELRFSDGWNQYCAVEAMFFELIDDQLFKFLVSIEIAIDNCNSVIRSPIPLNVGADEKAKAIISIQKAMEGNESAFKMKKSILAEMADGDKATVQNIEAGVKEKRRAPISPEGIRASNGD